MSKIKKKANNTNAKKSRKDLRKAKRNEKKLNKKIFFSKSIKDDNFKNQKFSIESKSAIKKNVIENYELGSDLKEKLFKMGKSKPIKVLEPSNLEINIVDRYQEDRKREMKKQKELERKTRKQRLIQLKEANENEDKIIRKLEKKLRIEKHRNEKSVHKMFSDGLDYALELCLPSNIDKMHSAAKDSNMLKDASNDEDDFEEDFVAALDKHESSKQKPNYENIKLQKKDNEELDTKENKLSKKYKNEMQQLRQIEKKNLMDSDFNAVDSDIVNLNDEKHSSDELTDNEEKLDSNDETGQDLEDIYGRKLDGHGNVIQSIQKYISPHIRARLDAEENGKPSIELKLDRLKKRCKGLLNRLSEANMHKVTSEIEQLYMSNSRFDMNNTLSNIILEALVINVLSKERMVLEYTLLIAILHGNVGSEVGAHFLQILATKFVRTLNVIDTLDVQNKELDNLVFILSHLYTFNIFQHSLIFEILDRLSLKLSEKSIECILLILKSVGFQLRKDDPSALKEFILSIQIRANHTTVHMEEKSRYIFMIEVLNAIKNNNMMKIPNYDPILAEHLKKNLKSMFSNGKYLSTLNITIDDLLNADAKGKWWVVGSAWSGKINDIGSAENSHVRNSEKFSDKLLDLARKQRMNTEDRRNVFCIIMSAEDYVDAFERLINLSLKDHRIISTIIIHCCLFESSFNPYYAALAKKICEHDRKYQLAIQFASWDRIKDIHSINKLQMNNFGKFITFLIMQGAQPISILKVIEFTELDKRTLRFVRQIILAILLGDEIECHNIFGRIAPSFKLSNFKDSLRLFMNHFLLKGTNENKILDGQMVLLKKKIDAVDNILAQSNSKLKF